MASFLQQFGSESHVSAATTTVTIPAGGIASGHSLILSIGTLANVAPAISSITISDARGNSYATPLIRADSGTTNPTNSVAIGFANIATPLQAGDTITITPDHNTSRLAVSVYEFDVNLTADQSASNDNADTSSSALSSGTTGTTTSANELVIGAFQLINAGRTFTLGAGYSEGTKVVTTNGSGDRAVVAEYKFVSATGTQSATGTLNSNGLYVGAILTFSYSSGGARPGTGKPKVWNGTSWTAHPAYSWDGNSWVPHKAKGWDGSNWVESK